MSADQRTSTRKAKQRLPFNLAALRQAVRRMGDAIRALPTKAPRSGCAQQAREGIKAASVYEAPPLPASQAWRALRARCYRARSVTMSGPFG
jgi:hypothetical protein